MNLKTGGNELEKTKSNSFMPSKLWDQDMMFLLRNAEAKHTAFCCGLNYVLQNDMLKF
jgi:hypothetical protein